MFNGKIHYKLPFSIAMLYYQRVGFCSPSSCPPRKFGSCRPQRHSRREWHPPELGPVSHRCLAGYNWIISSIIRHIYHIQGHIQEYRIVQAPLINCFMNYRYIMIYLPESLVVQGVICSSQGSDLELENHPFEVWNWWHNHLYGVDGESHRTAISPVFHGEKKMLKIRYCSWYIDVDSCSW